MDNLSDRDLLVKTATTVELLNTRLFGGEGQQGALPYLAQQVELKKKETDDNIKALTEKHEILNNKVNWFAGGISSIGAGATFLLTWLGFHHKG